MPKRKLSHSSGSESIRSSDISTTDLECDKDINDITNIPLQTNDEDFLDNTRMIMIKRRKHLEDFYDRTKKAPGAFDDEDNIFDDLTKNSPAGTTKKSVSINANPCQTVQSGLAIEGSFLTASSTLAATSRDPNLFSSSLIDNIKLGRDINPSLFTNKNHGSDPHLFGARSSSIVVDNQYDRLSNNRLSSNRLSLTQQSTDENETPMPPKTINTTGGMTKSPLNNQTVAASDDLSSGTNTEKKKAPFVLKSTITFGSPCIGNNRMDIISSQNTNSFDIDRSIIRLPDQTSQARTNPPSSSIVAQMRKVDVLSSMEYRELEKKNKDLLTKNENLKQALKKMARERKKFEETHMLKPRASFWNELHLFMGSHDDVFMGDGRTIEELGGALGLSSTTIYQVQQDAEKPDKVAMNVWRKICPTREDRLFVGSIKNVPLSTLQNIYMFARLCHPKSSLDFKKMRSDIAANLRQGHFYSKPQGNMSLNITEAPQNNQSNDENDITDSEEMTTNLQLFLKKNLIDYISDDDEE